MACNSYIYSGTSINNHLHETVEDWGLDWNYIDFNVEQPLKNGHLSTLHNEQIYSPLSVLEIENNLPKQTDNHTLNQQKIITVLINVKMSYMKQTPLGNSH